MACQIAITDLYQFRAKQAIVDPPIVHIPHIGETPPKH